MSAASDIGSGTVVEYYRGAEHGPFVHGARFVVTYVWPGSEAWGGCAACLPGWAAPAIDLAGFPAPRPDVVVCSCCFRPVRDGGETQSTAQETRAGERVPEGV